MSNSDLIKSCIEAALPKGKIWTYKENGDLDKLISGMADNYEPVQDFFDGLAYIRDPQKTPVLDDLERDFHVQKDPELTEQERRDQLTAVKVAGNSPGTAEFLENILREAGFDVYVHLNNPPIDPVALESMMWGQPDNPDAQWGGTNAQWGLGGRVEYVNMIWGNTNAVWGREDAVWGIGNIGKIRGYALINGNEDDQAYSLGDDSCQCFWSAVFFVGGTAQRSGTGQIISIETAEIPAHRRAEFEKLIMRIKPFFTWAGLVVNYT